MTLEQQVCSQEPAKKLKELGVKQKSLFMWDGEGRLRVGIGQVQTPHYKTAYPDSLEIYVKECFSAFTVGELGELLPDHFHTFKSGIDWWCRDEIPTNKVGESKYTFSHTEADARAKMLIYLLENKLITL